MTRRRILRTAGAMFAALAAITAACSFPEPSLSDVTSGIDGGDASNDNASVDSAYTVMVDGQDPNELIERDPGQKVDAGECEASCDCDKDSFLDYSRPECADAGGSLRDASDPAHDCDDLDGRTRPNQEFLEIPGEAPRNGDWNCKNGVEKLLPVNVTCNGLLLGACNGIQGFSKDPGCGLEGEYVFCQLVPPLNATCGIGSKTTRPQACK